MQFRVPKMALLQQNVDGDAGPHVRERQHLGARPPVRVVRSPTADRPLSSTEHPLRPLNSAGTPCMTLP
jgi:hypothetical protein